MKPNSQIPNKLTKAAELLSSAGFSISADCPGLGSVYVQPDSVALFFSDSNQWIANRFSCSRDQVSDWLSWLKRTSFCVAINAHGQSCQCVVWPWKDGARALVDPSVFRMGYHDRCRYHRNQNL